MRAPAATSSPQEAGPCLMLRVVLPPGLLPNVALLPLLRALVPAAMAAAASMTVSTVLLWPFAPVHSQAASAHVLCDYQHKKTCAPYLVTHVRRATKFVSAGNNVRLLAPVLHQQAKTPTCCRLGRSAVLVLRPGAVGAAAAAQVLAAVGHVPCVAAAAGVPPPPPSPPPVPGKQQGGCR